MSDRILRPVETDGKLLPFLDYRILQYQQAIEDQYDESACEMEIAGRCLDNEDHGKAADHMRRAEINLRSVPKLLRAQRELEWVRQHPKFNPNPKTDS
jgi:hypothetical protein